MRVEVSEQRFLALWRRCAASTGSVDGADVYRALARHYAEPHRRYHTIAHIEYCLGQFDSAVSAMQPECDADAVELALWFHDVLYEPGAPDNERLSADWFRDRALDALPPALVTSVERMILATVHGAPAERDDEQYVVDIDLSGFGFAADDFQRDSELVRDEFAQLCDAEFARRHLAFLKHLQSRESIFATEFFRSRYEHQARANIAAQIGVLEKAAVR